MNLTAFLIFSGGGIGTLISTYYSPSKHLIEFNTNKRTCTVSIHYLIRHTLQYTCSFDKINSINYLEHETVGNYGIRYTFVDISLQLTNDSIVVVSESLLIIPNKLLRNINKILKKPITFQ